MPRSKETRQSAHAGIALPLTARTGERHVAHVLPLTSGLRAQPALRHTAVAAVFVHKTALEAPSPPEAIAKAYTLARRPNCASF